MESSGQKPPKIFFDSATSVNNLRHNPAFTLWDGPVLKIPICFSKTCCLHILSLMKYDKKQTIYLRAAFIFYFKSPNKIWLWLCSDTFFKDLTSNPVKIKL